MSRVIYESRSPECRSVSDFVCRHNIFLFLHSAIANFELNMENHFFQPEDLYLCQDLGRTISTLSALSRCRKVKSRSNLPPGFPKRERQLAKKMKNEENDYSSLREMYGDAETEYIYDSFAKNVYSTRKEKDDEAVYEDIYQTICAPKQPRFSLDIFTSNLKPKSKRDMPINELIETEDKYLENLIMVRDVFRQPLNFMSLKEKDVIFFRLDELIRLHTELLMGLKSKNADIGDIFLRLLPIISRLYGDYCVNLPRAIDLLSKMEAEDPRIKNQLSNCQTKAKPSTFPLSSHLMLPFQRFLKYHLLLKEILKLTPDDHPHYSNLKKAMERVKEVGEEVNERKRDHEASQQQIQRDESDLEFINRVEKTIKLMQLPNGAKLSDFGRLRKAGDICVETCNGSKLSDYAFLFDTVMLLCIKPKWLQHRYRFRTAIKLRDYRLGGQLIGFDIPLYHKLSPARIPHLTLSCRNGAERDVWIKAINEALDIVDPRENVKQGHVLALTTFPIETECFQCGRVMAGIFYQGYRCQRCQTSLHKQCIQYCSCIEIGGNTPISNLTKAESVVLPTALSETLERSDSTLSLAPDHSKQKTNNTNNRLSMLQRETEAELTSTPIEQQSWYAGNLNPSTASTRLQSLPIGTFLIRKRVKGGYALALNTPGGVKHMCIQHDDTDFFFSDAKKFKSISEMVMYYRTRELTDNFDYDDMRGVVLKTPFKDI